MILLLLHVAEPNFILSSSSIWDKKVKGVIIPKEIRYR